MRLRRSLQLFALILRPTPSIVTMYACLLGFAIYLATVDPQSIDQTAGIALFVQSFAASTGYLDHARRGHFDAALVGRRARCRTACAHCVVSVAPGLTCWLALAVVDLVSRPTHWPVALSLPGLAAFLWVSSASWTVTLLLPRYSGGTIWMTVLVALAVGHRLQILRGVFLADHETWLDILRAGGAALLCPVFLVAQPGGPGDLGSSDALMAISVLMAGAVVGSAGAWMISALDVALVEPR